MSKKFTLFLAVCMLAVTSVSAATTETKTETKTEAKAEVKDSEKADAKEETKDDEKADAKDEAKDDEKADAKDEAKDDEKADAKDEAKDDEKADAKDETKDDKKAALTKEELEAKVKDLKQDAAVKAVNDGYKKLENLFAEHEDSSSVADYYPLKSGYATKEKVQEAFGKVFSAEYVEAFLKLDGKFKTIDEKCYVKRDTLLNKCDFSKATLKSKEVKDNKVNVVLETVDNNEETITYKAVLVYEDDAWKLDALSYTTQRGLTGKVLI